MFALLNLLLIYYLYRYFVAKSETQCLRCLLNPRFQTSFIVNMIIYYFIVIILIDNILYECHNFYNYSYYSRSGLRYDSACTCVCLGVVTARVFILSPFSPFLHIFFFFLWKISYSSCLSDCCTHDFRVHNHWLEESYP